MNHKVERRRNWEKNQQYAKKIEVKSRTSKKSCEETMDDHKIFCKNGWRSL